MKIKHLILIFILLSQLLLAWGNTGHRIVGKIAETYLTKNAKMQIKRLIGHHDLSRISNWADEIKVHTNAASETCELIKFFQYESFALSKLNNSSFEKYVSYCSFKSPGVTSCHSFTTSMGRPEKYLIKGQSFTIGIEPRYRVSKKR